MIQSKSVTHKKLNHFPVMKILKDIFRQWLPIAAVTTALCGLVYVAVQQVLRHSANDPQIQMAEDAAQALARDGTIETVLPAAKIEIAQSLAPFLTIFNTAGEPLASSGVLHGEPLHLPPGVFNYVRQHGEERVTWQPERGVRMASVVVRFDGAKPGYVLAGRSLREVEKREAQVGFQAGVAWLFIVGASLVLVALGRISVAWEMKGDRATARTG